MKKHWIAALALQLMGIYSIIISLPYISGIISSFAISGGWETEKYVFIGYLTTFILLFAAGWILIRSGNKIAKNNESSINELTSSDKQINFTHLSELSFAIFGLFLIISALSSLPFFINNLCTMITDSYGTLKESLYLPTLSSAINITAKIVFGAWLFIGSKSFVKLWQKLRQRWDYERTMDAK